MAELLDYLKLAVDKDASDLFIVAGGPVCVKLDKRMTPISEDRVFPDETERLITQLYELAGNRPMENYLKVGDDDFSFSVGGLARFRVNTYKRRGEPIEETPRRVVLADTGGELSIAAWDGTGRLNVENGRRTIKRLFADAGIPTEKRAEHPVVLLDGQVAAAFGVAADRRYKAGDGEACLAVTIA